MNHKQGTCLSLNQSGGKRTTIEHYHDICKEGKDNSTEKYQEKHTQNKNKNKYKKISIYVSFKLMHLSFIKLTSDAFAALLIKSQ